MAGHHRAGCGRARDDGLELLELESGQVRAKREAAKVWELMITTGVKACVFCETEGKGAQSVLGHEESGRKWACSRRV